MPTQSLGKCANHIAIIAGNSAGKKLLSQVVYPIELDSDIIGYPE